MRRHELSDKGRVDHRAAAASQEPECEACR